MSSSAQWIKEHQEELTHRALAELSSHDTLRKEAHGTVQWFFTCLTDALTRAESSELQKLMQNWVRMSHVPINGEALGLLPVLGAFKRAIWQELKASTFSDANQALAVAEDLESTLFEAANYLAKVEASTLLDTLSHSLAKPGETPASTRDIKSTFVAVASHELKTPLTVIEGYTNMLRLEQHSHTDARLASIAQGMTSGVARLRELIEDLIDASLIESGLLALDMQPVWLHHILRIAKAELKSALSQRNQTLTIQFDSIPSRPTVGSSEYLLKAFLKVLSNAIKYTPDGGSIVVEGRALTGFVDISIKDTGVGIKPEHLDSIFQSFAVLGDITHHSSSKTNFKGSGPGLGLVIAKGIIEAHQGTIWAESSGYDDEKFPGSHFHILLPLKSVSISTNMDQEIAEAAAVVERSQLPQTVETTDSVRSDEHPEAKEESRSTP